MSYSNIAILNTNIVSDTGWWPVKLRKELISRIEEFLETPEGKRTGYTNPAQVIDKAVRDMLTEYFAKRFEHINTFEDKVRILDNKIGKSGDIVTISFRGGKSGYCEHDQSDHCIHVKYAWQLDEVSKALKKHGLKPPID